MKKLKKNISDAYTSSLFKKEKLEKREKSTDVGLPPQKDKLILQLLKIDELKFN